MNQELTRKTDSMYNVVTGMGKSNRDKTMNTYIQADDILCDEELSACYREGLISRIVDLIPDDGTKNGWTYLNDEEEKIENYLEQLKLSQHLNKAWKYSRIYRGAIIVMIGNRPLEKPLASSEQITKLRTYSAARIETNQQDIVDDPKSPFFEEIEFYNVRLKSGMTVKVHASRCLIFKGELPPDDDTVLDTKYMYWGLSTIQKTWNAVHYYLSSMQGIANVMQEIVLGKYKMDNLDKILAMNDQSAMEKINTRLEAMALAKSVLGGVMIGGKDEYTRDNANLSGAGDILDRMGLLICAVANIPFTKLFGRSPAGMNSTGEGDADNYTSNVTSDQETILKPAIDKIANHVGMNIYKAENDYGVEEFVSIDDPNEKEKAETEKLIADKWQIYLQNGVVDSEYVHQQEFPEYVESFDDLPDEDIEEEL